MGQRGPKKGTTKPAASGRKKGVPNKNTQQIRDMIVEALNQQPGGGVAYFKRQAVKNPVAFMTLIGKVLPMQITGEGGNPIKVQKIELAPLETLVRDDEKEEQS
jgi:hypothetical protein